jgi:hypothetical protein
MDEESDEDDDDDYWFKMWDLYFFKYSILNISKTFRYQFRGLFRPTSFLCCLLIQSLPRMFENT